MANFKFGLVHAPLTPFARNGLDLDCFGKTLDFCLKNGAEGVAVPTHAGESVSLTVDERKRLLAFAVKQVDGRVPVIANVSDAGTATAASLATDAVRAGASAIMASVPYYWTPPQSMLVEHFATIGAAGKLPLFVYNSPDEMAGVEFLGTSVVELLERLPTFAGVIDASLDWQYMIEVVTVARAVRPDFQFVSGTEYMISASAIGASGLLSSAAIVAPRLVRELYRLCRAEKYEEARSSQEAAAILFRLLRDASVPGLKAAVRAMGRDCGLPRPPLPELDDAASTALIAQMSSIEGLEREPRGWA